MDAPGRPSITTGFGPAMNHPRNCRGKIKNLARFILAQRTLSRGRQQRRHTDCRQAPETKTLASRSQHPTMAREKPRS